MLKVIYEITEVSCRSGEGFVHILVYGKVNSGGWENPQLVPYIYIDPPEDGIYDFDFIADAPEGNVTLALEEIVAELEWADIPDDFKGVRVHSSSNNIESIC